MDFLLLILRIEFLLLALLFSPLLISRFLMSRNRPRQALPWARVTLAISRLLPTWRGAGNLNVATCYIMAGDFAEAQPYAEQAVTSYERHSTLLSGPYRAMALAYHGMTLMRSGQMELAEKRLDASLALGVRNPAVRAMAQTYAASIYLHCGRLTDAGRLMEEALAAPKLSEDFRISAEEILALQKYYLEDFAGGLTLARQAMQRKTAFPGLTVSATITAQDCLIELGDLREAQNLEAGLLAQLADIPAHTQAGALRASADLALKLGNLDRAREQAERAAALDARPNAQAGALLIQAEVFALRQNAQRAMSLTDAILRSDAIDFYKSRARAAQSRLSASDVPALL